LLACQGNFQEKAPRELTFSVQGLEQRQKKINECAKGVNLLSGVEGGYYNLTAFRGKEIEFKSEGV